MFFYTLSYPLCLHFILLYIFNSFVPVNSFLGPQKEGALEVQEMAETKQCIHLLFVYSTLLRPYRWNQWTLLLCQTPWNVRVRVNKTILLTNVYLCYIPYIKLVCHFISILLHIFCKLVFISCNQTWLHSQWNSCRVTNFYQSKYTT